jgi:type IV secretory pathway VirB9-like protein
MRMSGIAFLVAASAAPALADTDPPLPPAATHIRQAAYSQLQRTNIVGVVGQPVTITFPKSEEVYRVVQSARPGPDGTLADAGWQAPKPEEIKEQPLGNVVPLWPAEPGTSMLTITTKVAADGSQKVYAFRLVARAADAGAEDAPDVVQNLIFTGPPPATPAQQQAAAAAWWTKKHADDAAKAVEKIRADALTVSAETCHYTAKGKRPTAIEPRCPMDNGEWTFMRFPGLSRKPAIYVVTGDNEERLARQHGAGDFVVIEEIAARFRLRLGNEVLDVINDAYDPHGQPANTGTIVPGVVRDVIQAKSR